MHSKPTGPPAYIQGMQCADEVLKLWEHLKPLRNTLAHVGIADDALKAAQVYQQAGELLNQLKALEKWL